MNKKGIIIFNCKVLFPIQNSKKKSESEFQSFSVDPPGLEPGTT